MNKQEFIKRTVISMAHEALETPLVAIFNAASEIADTAEYRGLFDETCPDRTETPAVTLLRNIDWSLLRCQKDFLLEIRATYDNPSKGFAMISGLIHLLDAIQDAAVEEGTPEFDVFGFGSES